MPKRHTSAIKCGVIGYGGAYNMGKAHLDQMRLAGMVPTAVCELDHGRLQVAAADFPGIELYGSVAEMLERSGVELVAIITPHNTHAPLAVQCLSAGRHVVSEKPLAITTAECDDMIEAARRSDVLISTYHNRHWDGHILSAVDHILHKRWIGDVMRITIHWGGRGMPRDWWRSDRIISGGILYDWGVHLLEYALQLVPDAHIKEVTGFAHEGYWVSRSHTPAPWHGNPNEDEARLIARMSNGVAIDLTVTQIDTVGATTFDVAGTEGHYNMAFSGWTRTHVNRDGIKVIESGPHPPSEGHRLYQNIADHLMHGEPLVITPEWARRLIHMIDLGVQSAKQGRALPAVYP